MSECLLVILNEHEWHWRPSFGNANFVDYFQFHFSWQLLNVMILMHAIKHLLYQPQMGVSNY